MNSSELINVSASATTVPFPLDASRALLGCSLYQPECVATMWLYILICPVLLLVGTVGNALSFVVLTTTKIRHTAFGTYLSTLAVFDTLTLWITLPRHFVKWMCLIDVRELSEWSCRNFRFFQFSLMNTSAWLLVAVTAERCLSIYWPTKVRYYSSKNRTRIIIATLCCVHFLWNVHVFWTLGPQLDATGTKVIRKCGYPDAGAAYYWSKVHIWVDMVKLSILPFVIMLILNGCIVVSLRRRARNCRNNKGILNESNGGGGGLAPSSAERQAQAASSKTAMLLPVSIFFLVATAPTFVETAYSQLSASSKKTDHAEAVATLLDCVSTLLLYCNNAGNFILYCLSGATFRKLCVATLRAACCRKRTKDEALEEYVADTTEHYDLNGMSSTMHAHVQRVCHAGSRSPLTGPKTNTNGSSCPKESAALLSLHHSS